MQKATTSYFKSDTNLLHVHF